MIAQILANFLTLDFSLEVIAVATALLYVYFAAKLNKICFVFGFVSSLIYIVISFNLQYYFDTFINVFYVLMAIYGWFFWDKNSSKNIGISTLNKTHLTYWILFGLAFSILMASLANTFSQASLPYLDAFTTVFALIASYLVIKKKIENWYIWIAVDLVACAMYAYKGLYLTCFLFFGYSLMAFYALNQWRKKIE